MNFEIPKDYIFTMYKSYLLPYSVISALWSIKYSKLTCLHQSHHEELEDLVVAEVPHLLARLDEPQALRDLEPVGGRQKLLASDLLKCSWDKGEDEGILAAGQPQKVGVQLVLLSLRIYQ